MTAWELHQLHERVMRTFETDVSEDCLECVFFHPLRPRPCSCIGHTKKTGETCSTRVIDYGKPVILLSYCDFRERRAKADQRHAGEGMT